MTIKKHLRLPVLFVITSMFVLLLGAVVLYGAESEPADTSLSPSLSKPHTQTLTETRSIEGTLGGAQISIDPQFGTARFVRLNSPQAEFVLAQAGASASLEEQVAAFFDEYGSVFGVRDAGAELEAGRVFVDNLGMTHLTYEQVYQGVPVFGGTLRVHFDVRDRMTAVNGTFVPGIALNVVPRLDAGEAAAIAEGVVNEVSGAFVQAANHTLYVYNTGLIKGVVGTNRLVYEIEVGNGSTVREFVYVDAHSGEVVNQITGIVSALDRRVYTRTMSSLVWQEGDAFPWTGSTVTETNGVNNLITATEDSYNFFFNTFGYDSWDGAGGTMHTIYDDADFGDEDCPNAHWNGVHTGYCPGETGDDTVAHEWGHAYTDSTHDLIYQWQPGALNESYSDIWGEMVDLTNGSGTDSPNALRTDGECSQYAGSTPPSLVVSSPPAIAGDYDVKGADFNPTPPLSVTANVVLVDDGDDEGGAGSTTDGCQGVTGTVGISNSIALIDRGSCNFTVKVKNAQDAGAVGVIIVNNQGDDIITMGGTDPTITIPSVFLGQSDGGTIKAQLPGVNATVDIGRSGTDDSYRWLHGEDDWAGGIIRDMWNPNCLGDPGKVTDRAQYICGGSDEGGVHTNSGVPNHAFALLVDGGTYNGQTVTGIGMLKAAHIYWRAQLVYQTRTTDFAEHADALEQSCQDLIGVALTGFDGSASGQSIAAGDCDQVSNAITAVELRTEPTFCGWAPLLDPDPPSVCAVATAPFFTESFTTDPGTTWALTNTGVYAEYNARDWEWVDTMPVSNTSVATRTGGFYAWDTINYGDCTPGSDDQSGVMYLDSPTMTVPAGSGGESLLVVFEHYVATEADYDGGNVWVSVNGGPWQLVAANDFVFNAYNGALTSAGAGNTNPLEGQPAFHGTNEGSVSGSWGQSQVDVSAYASSGDEIRLRFAFGVDGCNGVDGWYVDSVAAYYCVAPVADISVAPGSLTSTLTFGQQETKPLTITNVGDGALEWWVYVEPWVQPNGGSNGIVSDHFTDPPPGTTCAADDFTLSEATTVTLLSAAGFVNGGSLSVATAITWYIYPDDGGQPAGMPGSGDGLEAFSFTALTTTAGVDVTDDVITLDLVEAGLPTLNLPAGTYWLVVYPSIDSTLYNRWNWLRGLERGADAMLADPGNNFGLGPYWYNLGSLVGWAGLEFYVEGYSASSAFCSEPGDMPWLSLSSTGGTVPFAMRETVDVTFDQAGVLSGVHTGMLCIESNDPDTWLVSVPLTLTVEGGVYLPVVLRNAP